MAVPYVTGIKEQAGAVKPFALTITPTLSSNKFVISTGPDTGNDTEITIHDISGRLVARYTNAETIIWHGRKSDGTVLPAGVYFVRALSNGHTAQEKLILVR